MIRSNLTFLIYFIFTQGVSFISNIIPKIDNKVLFFSSPDYSDNAKYIYEKMIELKLNKKLDLVWVVHSRAKGNVVRHGTLKYCFHILTAKYIIATHGVPYWKSRNQIAIFTEHGLPFKASGYLSKMPLRRRLSLHNTSKKTNYLLSTSRFHSFLLAAIYRVNLDKILITGFPRQDGLFSKNAQEMAKKIGVNKEKFSKIFLYVPTFRDWSSDDLASVVLTNDKLLSYLQEMNVLLVYKPHKNVVVDRSLYDFNHPNVMLLKDVNLIDNGLHLYEFLSVFDLVITDYSSIFYESSLIDVPIIFYMPDIHAYSMNRGFLFNPKKWLPGHITKTFDDLLNAINEVFKTDPYKQKRIRMKELMFDKQKNCSLNVITAIFHKYLGGSSK